MNVRITKPETGMGRKSRLSFRAILTASLTAGLIMLAGCGGSKTMDSEASVSAIHAAEAVGASTVPTASLYLQLAKEGVDEAKKLAESGDKEKADSRLMCAQADAELAVALSNGDADKKAAADAIERVQQLRKENNLPKNGN